MNQNDFVYKSIFIGATKAGAIERHAHGAAATGLDQYKKNRFTKVSKLIDDKIKEAKKLSK